MPELHHDEKLREEFNRWAESGKGESMDCRPIVESQCLERERPEGF
jgi:hypothetical protein